MISLNKEGGLWVATIDRQDKANSLTHDMLSRLCEIAEAAQEAQVLVLTGAGNVFSAGADLNEARAGLASSSVWERLSNAIAVLPGLSIAALNGTLAGGAMGMALACDLRVSVPDAKFFYPVMKLGFLPQPSDPMRMSALIGPARTKLLLMCGEKISAQDAFDYGLVDRIVTKDELMNTVRLLAADTLAAKPGIAAGIKEMC